MKCFLLFIALIHLISGTAAATIGLGYSNDDSSSYTRKGGSSFENFEQGADKIDNDNYNDIGAYSKEKTNNIQDEYAKLRKLGRLMGTLHDFATPKFGAPFDRERTVGTLKTIIPKKHHDEFEKRNEKGQLNNLEGEPTHGKLYRTYKRSPMCLRRCMAQGQIHPIQCHSLC